MNHMRPYMLATSDMIQSSNSFNADFLKFMNARSIFWDFDELFKRYMRKCVFDEISKAAELKMNLKNTIVHPWPMRLKKNATQQKFEFLHASGHNGFERYVKWNSVA